MRLVARMASRVGKRAGGGQRTVLEAVVGPPVFLSCILHRRFQTDASPFEVTPSCDRSLFRGFVQLDWATPLLEYLGAARLHLQITSGYGETLIDYNHKQTTIGIGMSFGDW